MESNPWAIDYGLWANAEDYKYLEQPEAEIPLLILINAKGNRKESNLNRTAEKTSSVFLQLAGNVGVTLLVYDLFPGDCILVIPPQSISKKDL